MSSVPVLNQQGQQVDVIELNDSIFGAEIKSHLFYDVVRMQLGGRRSANPATKNRARVSGGGKKPYKQKGTGRARQGSTRSPHFRGGGVVFGPNGRSYVISLNKKVKRAALISALSLRVSQSAVVVLDDSSMDAPKTKRFAEISNAISSSHALYILGGESVNFVLSARNIQTVKVLPVEGLNVYDILKYPRLVLTRAAVGCIEKRLGV